MPTVPEQASHTCEPAEDRRLYNRFYSPGFLQPVIEIQRPQQQKQQQTTTLIYNREKKNK